MKHVNPLKDIGPRFNSIQSPSRYIGGEYGITVKPFTENDSLFNFIIAFPDLYEIGMSNLAVKIIYNALNKLDGVRCERVFAPDTDFEQLLRDLKLPLYSLETGMSLGSSDMIGFSIGYELGLTEVLAMLELGEIPLLAKDRKEGDPIIFAGGCGVTNPAPMADFFDAFMIGEAEDALFEMVEVLSDMKKNGSSRKEMLDFISSKPFMWTSEKKSARKTVQNNFGLVPSVPDWFPLPSSKPVQDHGVIEIMRGCPNGCRFCHAGIYYRPTRVKAFNLIVDEIDHLVFDAGYREVSLNSLSSADFPDVEGLLDFLNDRYKGYNVSFQLPSLKVNSMSLGILEKLNQVRKSGLTFAVETPEEAWQLSLNKEVYAQHLEAVLKEAKAKGWSTAKFYFMIGLPVGDYFGKGTPENPVKSEEETIVEFLKQLQYRTRMQFNVNIGVFVPKPHTPYQWVRQLTVEEAKTKMDYFYKNLPKGKFKLGHSNHNANVLEGMLSRGNSDVGKVVLSAYRKGCRLDAWDDHLRKNYDLWLEAFEENKDSIDVISYVSKTWDLEEELPWDGVTLGPAKNFYKREWQRSIESVLTPRCMSDCDHPCGICNKKEDVKVYKSEHLEEVSRNYTIRTVPKPEERPESNIPVLYRVIFSFRRCNGAEFIAYLSQVELFHKAILRSSLPFVFTTGFNPLPRIEFATAMSLGVNSEQELAACVLYDPCSEEEFISKMNAILPEQFKIERAYIFPVTNMRKRETLTQFLWGGRYRFDFKDEYKASDFFESEAGKALLADDGYIFEFDQENGKPVVPQSFAASIKVSDKKFRTAVEEFFGKKWFEILTSTKTETLAKNEISGWTAGDELSWRNNSKKFKKEEGVSLSDSPVDFFTLFEHIATIHADLMKAKETLDKEMIEFYQEHPDVKEKHQMAKEALKEAAKTAANNS